MNNKIICPTCKTEEVMVKGATQELDEVSLVVEVGFVCENNHIFKHVYFESPDGCFNLETDAIERNHI